MLAAPPLPLSALHRSLLQDAIRTVAPKKPAQDWERWAEDPNLFLHPDPKAFQHLCYSFLVALDPSAAVSTFRAVWPIVEKKQEAEFRRNVFNCYKEWQIEHSDRLPMVNVSLLLTPGGPKFMHFMLDLARFLLERRCGELSAQLEPLLSQPGALIRNPTPLGDKIAPPLNAILTEAIKSKLREAAAFKAEKAEEKRRSEAFVEAAAERLRQLRKAVAEVREGVQEAGEDKQEQCRKLRRDTNGYAGKAEAYLADNQAKLDSFSAFMQSLSGLKLSLDSLGTRKLSSFLQRELDSCSEFKPVTKEAVAPLNGDRIHSALQSVANHQGLAAERKQHLQHRHMIRRNNEESSVRLGSKRTSSRPRLRINFNGEDSKLDDKFSLLPDPRPTKAQPAKKFNPEAAFSQNRSFWALPKFEVPIQEASILGEGLMTNSSQNWSLPRDPSSTFSELPQERRELSDHSKMSVFSPILSSSRMDSPPSSSGSISLWRQNSTSPTSSGPGEEQPENDLTAARWNPIRLSPSFCVESETTERSKSPIEAEKDQGLATKWGDLMDTLAQDPEDSFSSIKNLSALEEEESD